MEEKFTLVYKVGEDYILMIELDKEQNTYSLVASENVEDCFEFFAEAIEAVNTDADNGPVYLEMLKAMDPTIIIVPNEFTDEFRGRYILEPNAPAEFSRVFSRQLLVEIVGVTVKEEILELKVKSILEHFAL